VTRNRIAGVLAFSRRSRHSRQTQPHFGAKEKFMAKSQNHGNKEAKKPKQVKTPAPMASEGLLAKVGASPGAKKG
jgi:hypothetical protein